MCHRKSWGSISPYFPCCRLQSISSNLIQDWFILIRKKASNGDLGLGGHRIKLLLCHTFGGGWATDFGPTFYGSPDQGGSSRSPTSPMPRTWSMSLMGGLSQGSRHHPLK